MRYLIVQILILTSLAVPAVRADVLYAAYERAEPQFERDEALCGSGPGGAFVGYLGSQRVCADVMVGQLRADARIREGRIDEIVLLTSKPDQKTIYLTGLARQAILPLDNLIRRSDAPLTIRG